MSQPILHSYIAKEFVSKVMEQIKDLVNWLKEIKLKGQLGKKRTYFRYFRFKEEDREIWANSLKSNIGIDWNNNMRIF